MQKSLLAHMDKIQKQAKLGQMVKAIKQAKTVKHKKKTGQTSWIDLFATKLHSLKLCRIKEDFYFFPANLADFNFISLDTAFRWFLWPNIVHGKITQFCLVKINVVFRKFSAEES